MKVSEVTRKGKYYETRLDVELPDGRVVWVSLTSDDPEPSATEIERNWESREEFDNENCDGHYEREATRLVANALLTP